MEKKYFEIPPGIISEQKSFGNTSDDYESYSKERLIDLAYKNQGDIIKLEAEIKELQMALSRSELASQKYTALYDSSPVGLIVINNEGIILEANKTIAAMLGVEKHFLDNMALSRFIYVDDLDTYTYFRKKIINTSSLHVCDLRILKNDGIVQNVKLEGKEYKHKNKYSISISDNTASKTMEKMLRESEKKYRSLIEGLNEAIFKLRLPEGKYEFVSPSIQNVIGIPLERIYSQALLISDVIHPDQKDRFDEKWKEILSGKVEPTYEYKIIDHDGKERWILQSNKGIFDENGKIIALEGLCRNITKIKMAEQALMESEERFRAIANYTHDWENWISPDGGLIWVNPSVERITGYTVEECMAMENFPLDMIHEEDLEKTDAIFMEDLKNMKENDNVQFRIKCKDDTIKWMSAAWQPLYDSRGEFMGARSSIRDVTVRVEAQETMKYLVETLRVSNETIKKQVYEYDEIKQKYHAEKRRHQEFKDQNARFFSEISEDLVSSFTQFTRILRMISMSKKGIKTDEVVEKSKILLEKSEKSIKLIEKYFSQFSI